LAGVGARKGTGEGTVVRLGELPGVQDLALCRFAHSGRSPRPRSACCASGRARRCDCRGCPSASCGDGGRSRPRLRLGVSRAGRASARVGPRGGVKPEDVAEAAGLPCDVLTTVARQGHRPTEERLAAVGRKVGLGIQPAAGCLPERAEAERCRLPAARIVVLANPARLPCSYGISSASRRSRPLPQGGPLGMAG